MRIEVVEGARTLKVVYEAISPDGSTVGEIVEAVKPKLGGSDNPVTLRRRISKALLKLQNRKMVERSCDGSAVVYRRVMP